MTRWGKRAGRIGDLVVRSALVVALGATAVGCASLAAPPGPPPSTSGPSVAPGAVRLDGVVRQPTTLDPATLAGMPQTDLTVTYQSAQGIQTHQEHGVLLTTLLPPTALATRPDRKNDVLTFGVLAVGADGYQALVSYAEASPDFGRRDLLVALAEDGRPLPRPRLVVPGDVKGGRYVSDLVELRVIRSG